MTESICGNCKYSKYDKSKDGFYCTNEESLSCGCPTAYDEGCDDFQCKQKEVRRKGMTFNDAVIRAVNGQPCYRFTETCYKTIKHSFRLNLYFEYFGNEPIMKVTKASDGCECRLTEKDVLADDWQMYIPDYKEKIAYVRERNSNDK